MATHFSSLDLLTGARKNSWIETRNDSDLKEILNKSTVAAMTRYTFDKQET
jgi:hypothetical protein